MEREEKISMSVGGDLLGDKTVGLTLLVEIQASQETLES